MYKSFFGFTENPFKLVPNPAYLFLSKSHEEALAHLTYAVTQGEGFMDITGEVGTGKTTLCRAFLENLDHQTTAAYIFNPNLNSLQLLKAINDEFGIPSNADNIKDLIDTLNLFLIDQKAKGKNTILLIDEAQNLTNEVLEQLRLLSNFETTKHKLLQIFLVGQPELKEKLNSYELRQLGQRISLSCRLLPLNFTEVRNYIQHRIHIASEKADIRFDQAAYRSIYKYSRGIPRLINIVCDRALLTAFGLDRHEITEDIVRTAIKELTDREDEDIDENRFRKRKQAILLFFVLSLILVLLIFYRPGFFGKHAILNSPEVKKPNAHSSGYSSHPVPADTASRLNQPVSADIFSDSKKPVSADTSSDSKNSAPAVTPLYPQKIEGEKITTGASVTPSFSEPVRNFENLLETMNRISSRHAALKIALNLWDLEPEIKPDLDAIDDDQEFFRLGAKENGLLMRRIEGSLNAIKKLNLPAILSIYYSKDNLPVYLVLIKADIRKITLRGGKQDISMELTPPELESYWPGTAYIPWKNFLSITGTVPIDSPKDSILALKMLLRDIGFKKVQASPFYDDETREAVKKIQRKYGLHVDGAVGSTTKIALYNEKKSLKQPYIADVSRPSVR
jgi:general secretion pathway protein A